MLRIFCSIMQKSLEWILNTFFSGSTVFMFHQVNDNKKEWEETNLCITKKSFQEFIEKLIQKGYKFYPLAQITECKGKKVVFLTFDDIFSDVVENAIPYLIEKGIPFSVFVSDRFIDQEGYISKQQLRLLRNEPLCTIGYHSKSHVLMRTLSSEQTRIELNCSEFKSTLQRSVDYFAYPYGSMYACDWKSMKLVKKTDYKCAFSTISAPCTSTWLKFFRHFLPRVNINEQNYQSFLGRDK